MGRSRVASTVLGAALVAAAAACGGGEGPPGAVALTDGPWAIATGAEPAVFDAGFAGARLTYTIEGVGGTPVEVTGIVGVPDGDPPDGGWPVVAWAHGTSGIADACAPSVDGDGGGSNGVVGAVVDRGFVVAATDYEGLGGDGLHPYLDGRSEARSVAGAVAAAAEVLAVPLADRWLVYGGSQGGHAALFTAELGSDAVPGMTLIGAAAAAPVTDLRANTAAAASDFAGGVQALLLAGLLERQPAIDPATLLTDAGVAAVATAATGCSGDLLGVEAPLLVAGADEPGTPYGDLLDAAGVAQVATDVPILVAMGTADLTVPAAATAEAVERMCALGDVVELRAYEGEGHLEVLQSSAADVLAWTIDRFAGEPAPSTC